MCEEKYKHYSSELSAEMGLSAEDCSLNDENDAGERWAEIGVKRRAQQGNFFYLYLNFYEDDGSEGTIDGCVYLDLYYWRLRDEIFEGFRQKIPRCRAKQYDTYGLILNENLKNLASAGDPLDALVVEWLGYCKSIGGLKLANRGPAEG
jgi:hypothetical protein